MAALRHRRGRDVAARALSWAVAYSDMVKGAANLHGFAGRPPLQTALPGKSCGAGKQGTQIYKLVKHAVPMIDVNC